MIPSSWIANYSDVFNELNSAMLEDLAADLSRVDVSDYARAMVEIADIVRYYIGTYTELSAELSANFYEMVRADQLGGAYTALRETGLSAKATDIAISAIIAEGSDSDISATLKKLQRRADYEMRKALGTNTLLNVAADPKKPRFARVPQPTATKYTPWKKGGTHNKDLAEHGTCRFCRMLASRGWVYHTRDSAGEFDHYHDGCNCKIVPSWDKSGVQGYSPDEYAEEYLGSIEYDEYGHISEAMGESIGYWESASDTARARHPERALQQERVRRQHERNRT